MVGPLVPDGDAALLEPADIGIAAEEPQQLNGDGPEVHTLRRDQRKSLRQVEADLTPEHTGGAGAGTVVLVDAVRDDLP